jgi:hypothetical protein
MNRPVQSTASTGGEIMFKSISTLALAALFCAPALAADNTPNAPKQRTPQQEKMAQCGKDSKGKKGEERKAFMKACLSSKAEAAKN